MNATDIIKEKVESIAKEKNISKLEALKEVKELINKLAYLGMKEEEIIDSLKI